MFSLMWIPVCDVYMFVCKKTCMEKYYRMIVNILSTYLLGFLLICHELALPNAGVFDSRVYSLPLLLQNISCLS